MLDQGLLDRLVSFLKGFTGGVLLVFHDRYFPDEVVVEIWELERSGGTGPAWFCLSAP